MSNQQRTYGRGSEAKTPAPLDSQLKTAISDLQDVATTAMQCGRSVPWVWQKARTDATFARPFKVSSRRTCFSRSEVSAWLESKRVPFKAKEGR